MKSIPVWLTRKQFLHLLLIILTCLGGSVVTGQDAHPHIVVTQSGKAAILNKINQQGWAKQVFQKMEAAVQPYAARHQTDTAWILSRYLLNRVPGRHYTRFYSDADGTALVKYEGNAPVPTIRISPHKRPPITADGYSYKMPAIEELVPYDTSLKMLLQRNAPDRKKEWVDPGTFVEGINGKINELALNAAILYWLTGKPMYAKFAADILTQWVKGAFYQYPVEGPCRTGFLSIQTLGDRQYCAMVLAYDFLYDYIRTNGYDTACYETVFDRIAATMTFRGYWNNNWFAAQTPAMVYAALSLENKKQRNYYLDFYLKKDTINGECGHLALPSVLGKWLTPDGHWKEPGGYHNFPISSLLTSALALENNGYNVFGNFPALLQSSYVLLKYSFPDFSAPSIGDTGPASQSPEMLEMGLLMAEKYQNPVADNLVAALNIVMQDKEYKRESADWLGLLSYLPEIPARKGDGYSWPRSGKLDFAKCYLQRNGSSAANGLMYLVQGASYNHNHANGMSLELYGAGSVMGIDPGKGLTYEAPMHVNYYAQWAAHNTVSAAAMSASVPYFKGGGGEKKMGAISLAAMEPLADQEAVSANCSFTDTRYTDISTQTKQQRTLAIIRTSASTGYYVDIYRSDNPVSNEYIYHNIGNDLFLSDTNRKPIPVKPTVFPLHAQPFDPPGFRVIKDYQATSTPSDAVIALFSLKEKESRYMQVLFAGARGRTFFTGKAPASGTAIEPYRDMPTPVLINRQQGEAWTKPFIAVYEPFAGANNFNVQKLESRVQSAAGDFTAIEVVNKDQSSQIILQSLLPEKLQLAGNCQFRGNFGVVGLVKNRLAYLYMGDGKQLAYQLYQLESAAAHGSVSLLIKANRLEVSCRQPTTIGITGASFTSVLLTTANVTKSIPVTKTKSGVSFTVPGTMNATIELK